MTNDTILNCPECGQETNSIRKRVFVEIRSFVFFYLSKSEVEFTCPKCARKRILKYMFHPFWIISQNLIWPFLFIFYLGSLVLTLRSGHSAKAIIYMKEMEQRLASFKEYSKSSSFNKDNSKTEKQVKCPHCEHKFYAQFEGLRLVESILKCTYCKKKIKKSEIIYCD